MKFFKLELKHCNIDLFYVIAVIGLLDAGHYY